MNIQPNIVTKRIDGTANDLTGPVVGSFVSTHQPRWRWLPVDRDGTTYTAYGTLGTKPTTGILYEGGTEGPTLIRVQPWTATSTNTTGGVRVVGWSMYLDGSTEIWTPTILAEASFTRTSGTTVNMTLATVAYYSYGGGSATATITPAPNMYVPGVGGTNPPASMVVDTMGSEIIQVRVIAPAGNFGVLWCTL